MKANQFFNKILDKWPVKVACLIIAIAFYVFHQSSLTEKRSFAIPLQLIEDGAVIHTGDYASTVTVNIKANTEQASSVHSNQLKAYVNLNDISKSGEYTLPVHVKVADEISTFDPFEIKVKPEFIKLKVENKDLKYIYVEPSVIGEPEHGYTLEDIIVTPNNVQITGPKSIVENTSKIYTERVDIDGLAQKQSFIVGLYELNKMLTVKDTHSIEVTVVIEPKPMDRLFDDFEITVNGLNDSLYIIDGNPLISFELSGTMPVLESYEPSKRIASINLRNITEEGEYEVPVNYSIPPYLSLKESSQTTVKLNLAKKVENLEENQDEEIQ